MLTIESEVVDECDKAVSKISELRYHKFVCPTHTLHLSIDVLGARKGLGIGLRIGK